VPRATVLLLAAVGAGALVVLGGRAELRDGFGHVLELMWAGDLAGVRDYLRGFGVWAPLVSVALMQVQAVIAPLPSFPLMYANGLLFGTIGGGLLSWASILLSAVLCFGLARFFGRPLVTRVISAAALGRADQVLARFGPFALFVARLIPLTSFDLLSYAAGLTPMRLGPFCLATGLGMAPAIFLSAAAGEIGVRSPWAFLGGILAIAGLAGLAALLRPVVTRQLGRTGAVSGSARALRRRSRSTRPVAGGETDASDGRGISRLPG
jgi:uncharacterized membrane protein YdjX (TVP38/TMEM64 family)